MADKSKVRHPAALAIDVPGLPAWRLDPLRVAATRRDQRLRVAATSKSSVAPTAVTQRDAAGQST